MNPLNLMKTNTTKFMLAMIFNDDITYTDILKDHFINSFVSDFYRPENDGTLLVVKSIDEAPRGTINNPIVSYQNDDDFVFAYEIPDKYLDDYAMIVSGDWNNVSDEYKQKLLKFWECDQESMMYLILYVDSKLRERFNYNALKEIYAVVDKNHYSLE